MASFFWDRNALACWRSGELPTAAGEWRCCVAELSGCARAHTLTLKACLHSAHN